MTKMVTKILREAPSCRSRRHIGQSRQPQVRPGLQLCVECRDELENDLVELPEWYESCEHVLDHRRYRLAERSNGHNHANGHIGEGGNGNGHNPDNGNGNGHSPDGTKKSNGIRLADAAVTVRSDIIGVLSTWCGLVVAERGVTKPDHLNIRQLTGFLGIHLGWLTAHPAAPDFADEISDLAKRARAVVRPDAVIRLDLGPCVQPGCGRTVYALSRDEDGAELYRVSCEAGHVWRPDQWLVLGNRLEQARRARNGEQS